MLCHILGEKQVSKTYLTKILIREGFKKNFKKWLDLSNAHLTPASQAERLIKKIQKLHNLFYVFIISIINKFGENFEDKIDICFF